MRTALATLDRAALAVITALMAAMVVNVAVQVLWRHGFDDPPTWTEELARYLFTWVVFLGAGLAFGRHAHIVVDALLVMLGGGCLGRRVALAANALTLMFLLVLVWQGVKMAWLTSNMASAALHLNMAVVYAALPVGAALGAIFVAGTMVGNLRGELPAAARPAA